MEVKKGNTGISDGVVSHRLASNNKVYIKKSLDIARPNYTSHWACRFDFETQRVCIIVLRSI